MCAIAHHPPVDLSWAARKVLKLDPHDAPNLVGGTVFGFGEQNMSVTQKHPQSTFILYDLFYSVTLELQILYGVSNQISI